MKPDCDCWFIRLDGDHYPDCNKGYAPKEDHVKPLLVIACGSKKIPTKQPVEAIRLYDGPQYRMLRKYGFARPDGPIEIVILSAKHGLIPAQEKLTWYNQMMDDDRMLELIADTDEQATLWELAEGRTVYMFGGALYRTVVSFWCEQCGLEFKPVAVEGSRIGEQLSQLKTWLGKAMAKQVVP